MWEFLYKVDLAFQEIFNPYFDIEEKDEKGDTKLMQASLNGNAPLVRALLMAGANIHTTNRFGDTPLYSAVMSGNIACVRTLITENANLTIKTDNLLSIAIYSGRTEMFNVLLDAITKSCANFTLNTWLLDFAFERKLNDIAIALIDAGISLENNNDYRPLLTAVKIGNPSLVKVILNAKSSFNDNYIHLLNLAVTLPESNVALLLLNAKSRFNYEQSNLVEPLIQAVVYCKTDLVEALLKAGANPFDLDNSTHHFPEKTPLHYALNRGFGKIAIALLNAMNPSQMLAANADPKLKAFIDTYYVKDPVTQQPRQLLPAFSTEELFCNYKRQAKETKVKQTAEQMKSVSNTRLIIRKNLK